MASFIFDPEEELSVEELELGATNLSMSASDPGINTRKLIVIVTITREKAKKE
jgi:hypothetical protein